MRCGFFKKNKSLPSTLISLSSLQDGRPGDTSNRRPIGAVQPLHPGGCCELRHVTLTHLSGGTLLISRIHFWMNSLSWDKIWLSLRHHSIIFSSRRCRKRVWSKRWMWQICTARWGSLSCSISRFFVGGSDAIPTRCLSSEHSPEMTWMINWSVKEGEGKICFLLPQCYRQQLDAWTKKHGFSTTLHSSINVCVLLHRLVCKLWMKKKIETLYCRYTVIKSVSLPCHIHREMSKSGEGEVYVYPD